jgi:hypothetical protein
MLILPYPIFLLSPRPTCRYVVRNMDHKSKIKNQKSSITNLGWAIRFFFDTRNECHFSLSSIQLFLGVA